MGVRELYERTLAERGYRSDPAQLRAIDALERCENEWADYKARRNNAITKLIARPPIPRGVYLWGGVGRGKSFLMDCFYNSVPLQRKTRLHFHEFMREVHRELQELKGTVNPLDELGRRIAQTAIGEFTRFGGHQIDSNGRLFSFGLTESLDAGGPGGSRIGIRLRQHVDGFRLVGCGLLFGFRHHGDRRRPASVSLP